MRRGAFTWIVAAWLIAAAPWAGAQTASLWEGDAGWLPVAPAQLHTGEHRVGDIVLEVELARSRTGRIASDIVLRSDQHGEVTIPAETPVVANRQTSVAVQGGRPLRTLYGAIEWCTVAEMPRICIAQSDGFDRLFARDAEPPPPFVYTEYSAPARLSGRFWRGDEPAIREERVEFETNMRKQLIVREISANGVFFTLRTIRNGESTDVEAPEPIAYGARVHDSRSFSGVAFQFRRAGRERIVLEAVAPPAE